MPRYTIWLGGAVTIAITRGLIELDTARQWLRSVLVVAEVTLSVALLIGAGLILNSLWHTLHVNPGFNSHGVLTTRLSLSDKKSESQQVAFYRELFDRIPVLPGVTAVGAVAELPLSGQMNDDFFTPAAVPPASSLVIISNPWAFLCCRGACFRKRISRKPRAQAARLEEGPRGRMKDYRFLIIRGCPLAGSSSIGWGRAHWEDCSSRSIWEPQLRSRA